MFEGVQRELDKSFRKNVVTPYLALPVCAYPFG